MNYSFFSDFTYFIGKFCSVADGQAKCSEDLQNT